MNQSPEHQFSYPLEYVDDNKRQHLYRKVILKGTLSIVIGLTIFFLLPAILSVLDPNEHFGRHRNDGAIGFILIVLALGLPPYGAWQLVTIKNQATALARKELLAQKPELAPLEAERKKRVAKQTNRLLKITTALVAIIVIILIVVATSMILSFKNS